MDTNTLFYYVACGVFFLLLVYGEDLIELWKKR